MFVMNLKELTLTKREDIISQFRTGNIDLHEITIEDLEVSHTTLDDYQSLFNITFTDNFPMNLTYQT